MSPGFATTQWSVVLLARDGTEERQGIVFLFGERAGVLRFKSAASGNECPVTVLP